MYKEFDSIFHEETIVYEDNSDIQRQYAGRVDRARSDSKAGHSGVRSRKDMSKESPKTWSKADGNVDSKSHRSKIPTFDKDGKMIKEREKHGTTKRSKEIADKENVSSINKESSLFLDFDLI